MPRRGSAPRTWRGPAAQPTFPVSVLTFGADGRQLALGDSQGNAVVLYETAGWTETSRLAFGAAPIVLAFHPDGTRLAVCVKSEFGGPIEVRPDE